MEAATNRFIPSIAPYMFLILIFSSMLTQGSLLSSIVVRFSFNSLNETIYFNNTYENITEVLYRYSGKPLFSLLNKTLYVRSIGVWGDKEAIVSGRDEDSHRIIQRLGDIHYLFIERLLQGITPVMECSFEDTVFYDESLNMIIKYAYSPTCNTSLLFSDIGFIAVYKGDGVVNKIKVLSNDEVEMFITRLERYFKTYGVDKVLYAGISGEENIVETKQEFININSTYYPKTYRVIRLVNPHHRFYILINDIRIAYPIKYGVEDVDDGFFKYFEAFIPIPAEYVSGSNNYISYNFTVTQQFINKIVNAYNEAIDLNASAVDLRIADIYYGTVLNNSLLAPILEIYKPNTSVIVDMALLRDKILVLGVKISAGEHYIPSDIKYPFRTLINEYNAELKHFKTIEFNQLLIIVSMVIAIPTMLFLVLKIRKRK